MEKPTPRINAPLREKFIGIDTVNGKRLKSRTNCAYHWETTAVPRWHCDHRRKRRNQSPLDARADSLPIWVL